MGVSSVTNRVLLAGNGISTSFAFPYYFFHQADLIVYVYDTLLGGIIGPYILNVDYTVSGTPNYQGLYQSGANVVFSSYVPLTTDVVVIIRNPIQQQNYSLLQGGTISSAAIVQQFDYLTLLVQRLQDEVARAIQIPDGLGEAFSGALPSTTALLPGAFVAVNASGNGWQLVAPGGGGSSSGTVTNAPDANYTVQVTDQYIRSGVALTANRNWDLVPAATIGQRLILVNLSTQAHNITVNGNGGDLINSSGSYTLAPGVSITIEVGAVGHWDII